MPRFPRALLLVRGILLIEVANCLEPLVEAFHFGLVFRPEDSIPRKRLFALAGREDLAPVLAVRDAVDERVAREAPQVAQEAVAGIEIAGIYKDQSRIVEKGDADDQR